jgi:hypothetical protein
MRKTFTLLFALLLCFFAREDAGAQTKLPAKQVTVDSSSWNNINPATNTAQSVFDFLDTEGLGGSGGYGTNTYVNPATWQQILQTPSIPTGTVVQAGNTTNFVFVSWSNSYWSTDIVTNWNGLETFVEFDGNKTAYRVRHPDFVVQDNIQFPSFVTKEEFYATLNTLGFANYDPYTFFSTNVYGSPSLPPTNNSVFLDQEATYWTVPGTNLVSAGQVIRVHLWGAGNADSSGGYTYGDLQVVNNFTSSVPWQVTNGMRIAVHIGSQRGRSSIWRLDSSNFNTWTNELLVAGGAGAGGGGNVVLGSNIVNGSSGGGVNGINGESVGFNYQGVYHESYGAGGGTQTNGGFAGTSTIGSASPGTRVWGGGPGPNWTWGPGNSGGDGYYGGGGSSVAHWQPAGSGGGSGFVAANWNSVTGLSSIVLFAATEAPTSRSFPPKTSEAAYGLNAGYPGNPGRVAFEIKFDNFGN